MTGPFPPIQPFNPPDQERRLHAATARVRRLRSRRAVVAGTAVVAMTLGVVVPLSASDSKRAASVTTGQSPTPAVSPLTIPTGMAVPTTVRPTTPTTEASPKIPIQGYPGRGNTKGSSIVATTTPPPAAIGVWTDTTPAGMTTESFTGLTCPTADDCFALPRFPATGSSAQVLVSSDGGTSWSLDVLQPSGTNPHTDGISCPTADFCMVVGESSSNGDGSEPGVWVSQDGGSSWAAATAPTGITGMLGVSCSTSSDCLALGYSNATIAYDQTMPTGSSNDASVIEQTTDGGTSWTAIAVPPGMFATALTCTTAISCILGGGSAATPANAQAVTSTSSDGGETWSTPVAAGPGSYVKAISCTSQSSCVAATGPNYSSADNGVLISTSTFGTAWNVVASTEADDVSCSGDTCLAVGYDYVKAAQVDSPTAYLSTNAGRTFVSVSVPGSGALLGVACLSPANCVVGGNGGDGLLRVLTYNL